MDETQDCIARLRSLLEQYAPSRERSLALTKLDECELWLTRCSACSTEVA